MHFYSGVLSLLGMSVILSNHAVLARGMHKSQTRKGGKSQTRKGGKSSDTSDNNFGSRPNILFLLVDDWGAGDVDMCPPHLDYKTCPFRPTTKGRSQVLNTPRVKQMASEGQILTNFYSPRAICTPSRAGYLSGRDASRYGLVGPLRIITSSGSRGGFTPSEKTWAEYLKDLDYTTGYSGKWHLGLGNGIDPFHYTPVNQGFDEVPFFIEGSNGEQCENGGLNPPDDNNVYHMCSFDHIHDCNSSRNPGEECEVVEQPIRWENVTARHLKATLDFIDRHKDDEEPWVFNHAFTQVHVPWVPSRHFVMDPVMKFFTDTVAEVDWAVGAILQRLKDLGIAENTLVILSSDNGPYLESASSRCPQNCKFSTPEWQRGDNAKNIMCTPCDSDTVSLPGPHSGGKGNTWEAGHRVPAIAWWPGKIQPGSVNPVVASGLDLLPSFVALAGGEPDEDIALDGRDISYSLFSHPEPDDEPEGTFVYWCGNTIMAVRTGRYKTIWWTQNFVGKTATTPVPGYLCGGTGKCCEGSPSRLCLCDWADQYEIPKVIDLVENSYEDLDQALPENKKKTKKIIEEATKIRFDRMKSTVMDRNLPSDGTYEEMENFLMTDPVIHNLQDFCLPEKSGGGHGNTLDKDTIGRLDRLVPFYCDNKLWEGFSPSGCEVIPDDCRANVPLPGEDQVYSPQQNCSIAGTYAGVPCQKRFPCCEQEGYEGPFEFVVPNSTIDEWPDDINDGNSKKCGCFKEGSNGGHSYFPGTFHDQIRDDLDEFLMNSVCKWHNDTLSTNSIKGQKFCQLPYCIKLDDYANNDTYNEAVEKNQKYCHDIAKYGLSTIPTGNMFNSPYPDTQNDTALRYTNTKTPPFPVH